MTDKEKKQVQEFKKDVEVDIHKRNKRIETIAAFIILAFVAIFAVAGAVYYVDKSSTSDDYVSDVTVKKSVSKSTTKDALSDWKTYTNTVFGFMMKYPTGWTLTDNLPTSTTVKGKAQNSLIINNNEKYSMVSWINPDGFGFEGAEKNLNFEGTTVNAKKITLGTRKLTVTTPGEENLLGGKAEGFMISTSFTYNNNNYIYSMTGEKSADLTEAETYYKQMISSVIFN